MSGKDGIHHKNIEVRSMVRNNQVRSFRKLDPSKAMYPDPAKNTNCKAPDHIDRETPFSPGDADKCQINKRVKEQQSDYEDQPYVKLIT